MIIKFIIMLMMIMPASAADLRVVSWNTFMLPKPLKKTNQNIRTGVIADALKGEGYDFIFMQEAFMGSFRSKVGKTLKSEYPHQYYLKNNRLIYPFFGSGVFVMGRHPFKVIDRVYYNKCGAADCWAAKGSVLIEATLPSGKGVQFAVTHLQAKESLGSVRISQLTQVKNMLTKNQKRGVAQFLIGDLNIDVKEPEFQAGLELMGMSATELTGPVTHTNVIDCYKKPDHEREWIDHMWVSNDTQLKDSTIQVREVQYQHKGKTCMASDHHAVEGLFTFAD